MLQAIVIERDRRKESESAEKSKKNKDSNGNKSDVVNDERKFNRVQYLNEREG